MLAASPACGRIGYEPVATASGDASAGIETNGVDLAPVIDRPPIDRPPLATDADVPPPDLQASPLDVAADVTSDVAADRAPIDVGPVVPARCTEPGGRIDPATGRCYFTYAMAGVWADARVGCEAQGAHLATLTTAAEQAFALSLLGTEDLWIGLHRTGTDSWQWVTGEPVAFMAWAPLEPDEATDVRGRLLLDGWHGTDIRRRFFALCERDP